MDVPIYLRSTGEPDGGETGLGELGVDGKISLLDRGLDLALGGRVFLPTATVQTALGSPRTGYELTGIVSGDAGLCCSQPTSARVEGRRRHSRTSISTMRSSLAWGGARAVGRRGHCGLSSARPCRGLIRCRTARRSRYSRAPRCVPDAVTGWSGPGGGTGITTGIGSPDFRLILGLGWEPTDDDEGRSSRTPARARSKTSMATRM